MDEQFLKAMHPVTAVLHWKILSILKQYDIKTVLDVGGTGKLDKLSDYDVTNANIQDGIDGCALPYDDNSFDAVVSVATLEHVCNPNASFEDTKKQVAFLNECFRVAKTLDTHWFPYGLGAVAVEILKKKYGHYHPCFLPESWLIDDEGKHFVTEFMTCGEHLLLCMTLTPSLKVPEVYDFIVGSYDKPYGIILTRVK